MSEPIKFTAKTWVLEGMHRKDLGGKNISIDGIEYGIGHHNQDRILFWDKVKHSVDSDIKHPDQWQTIVVHYNGKTYASHRLRLDPRWWRCISESMPATDSCFDVPQPDLINFELKPDDVCIKTTTEPDDSDYEFVEPV